jgi:hypothetical protein
VTRSTGQGAFDANVIDAAVTEPADKDRDRMKALLIHEARMIFVSLGTGGAPTYKIETLGACQAMSGEFL